MKTVKSLLLGAVAAISMAGAASAADLPVAEPVEYVRVCDAFGAGFFFIPGTDTCLRISGFVRVDTWVMSDNWTARTGQQAAGALGGDNGPGIIVTNLAGPAFTTVAGTVAYNATSQFAVAGAFIPVGTPLGTFVFSSSDLNDQYGIGVRALLRFDARSRTEWGVLRSFFEFAANSNNSADNGAALVIRYGFVQFGPITAGVTDSFFNGDNGPTFLNHTADRSTRSTLLAYTAAFGNGISATISLEDPEVVSGVGGSTTIFNNGAAAIVSGEGWVRQGIRFPDIVGVIRVQQAWGAAQINGVIAHREMRNVTCFNAGLGGFCDTDDTGWAIGGMLRLDIGQWWGAAGSNILLKASYGEGGGVQYLGNGIAGGYIGYSFAPVLSGAGALQPGFDNRVGVTTGYALYGHIQWFFTPAIRAALMASYIDYDYDYGGFSTGSYVINMDRAYTISGQIVWSPVRNLDLGLEVFYVNARYEVFNGTTTTSGALTPGASARATDDGWGAIFRIQRSF
jgi:hypothetical protein